MINPGLLTRCDICGQGQVVSQSNGYGVCSVICDRKAASMRPGGGWQPTLRDRFAMVALQGMLAHPQCDAGASTARYAYLIADAMLEARVRGRAMTNWTPVAERMPPNDDLVLCHSPKWGYVLRFRDSMVDRDGDSAAPTHWMPLPEPPEPLEEPKND